MHLKGIAQKNFTEENNYRSSESKTQNLYLRFPANKTGCGCATSEGLSKSYDRDRAFGILFVQTAF